MTETPRPPEGPDREALALRLSTAIHDAMKLDVPLTSVVACRQIVDDLALLPTPPAPGRISWRDEDGIYRTVTPPAPGDGEGLRAEVERWAHTWLADWRLREPTQRIRELRAALAARDTDQGAREALALVDDLQASNLDWSPSTMRLALGEVRAALARATPEAGEGKP